MNKIERDDLLTALYQVTLRGDLLSQFNSKLVGAKGTKAQRYTFLLEQIMFYSHAIIFGHGVQTAQNYRQDFMTVAKKNKLLKLNDKDIERAFSFFNTTRKKNITKAIASHGLNEEGLEINGKCIAKVEINRLKAQLDTNSYKLAKGQNKEDKEAFIKIALVALSTGARLKDIMEDLTVSTKKGVVVFDNSIKQEEGVILELDIRTVQGYLRDIRSHYSDRIAKGINIGSGIRKAVKRLKIQNCQNINHLNALHKKCLNP